MRIENLAIDQFLDVNLIFPVISIIASTMDLYSHLVLFGAWLGSHQQRFFFAHTTFTWRGVYVLRVHTFFQMSPEFSSFIHFSDHFTHHFSVLSSVGAARLMCTKNEVF